MASFGRKPARGLGVSSARAGAGASTKSTSDSFRRLQEEEAERARFAKEFEEREKNAKEADSRAEQEAKHEKQEKERLQEQRRGQENPEVFLEVEIRNHRGLVAKGRLDFELYADVVPKTAENFRCLCTGERGRDLHFKSSMFHRIIPGFMAQGGDITAGDGTGGLSIYGPRFKDEGFERRHERPGVLSMANSGKDSNNSQFFVLFKSAPHLDFKHVVFGHLIREENSILKQIEECGSDSGSVKGEVEIVRCGAITARTTPPRRNLSRSRSRRRGAGRSQLNANIIG